MQSVTHTGGKNHQPQHKEPAKRLYKFAELRSGHHQREVMRHQFACAHCRFRNTQTNAGAEPKWIEVENPQRMDLNGLRCHLRARYGLNSLSHSQRWGTDGWVIRHKVQDVRNEDYYWLPWDESMEPSKKEAQTEKEVKKAVYVLPSPLCSVTKPGVHIAILPSIVPHHPQRQDRIK